MEKPRNFRDLLQKRWDKGLFACVGLDSEYEKIPILFMPKYVPEIRIFRFNKKIIDATHDLVCAYKPNIAFYEAMGELGMQALLQTMCYIRDVYPEIPIILDAKRADIGNTNNGYAKAAFAEFGADAITVNPYFGSEAMKPFLEEKNKGIIVLCRTSNPGAGEFQDLMVVTGDREMPPLYQYIANQVANVWNTNGNCALVVGATNPAELAAVRKIVGRMPILIPGIGKQGGDLEATVKAGQDDRGQGMIINSSREIIFASSDEDFAEAARAKTIKLNNGINQYRLEV